MLDEGMMRMSSSVVENEIRLQPLLRELLIQSILELENGNALQNYAQERNEPGNNLRSSVSVRRGGRGRGETFWGILVQIERSLPWRVCSRGGNRGSRKTV